MAYIGNKPPVVSNLITDLKIGEDDETKIDFADANTINFHANNAKEMVLVENALTPGTSDGTALGTTSLMWSDLFLASGAVMNFNNGNVTITHTNGTGLTINSTNKLMFGDAASFIQQSSDGVLRIDGEATVDINASTAVTVSNDLKLDSDSAVLSLGADDDATLTHDGTTGLTIAANPFEVDSGGNITLDAHTGIFIFQDANSEVLRITEGNSGDVTIKLETNAKDLIFTDNGDAEGFRILDGAAGVTVAGSINSTLDVHLDSTPSDETVSGITGTFTAGEALVRGECVYLKASDTKMHKAVAAAGSVTPPCIALAAEDIAQDAAGKFLLQGFITDNGSFPTYTVGDEVYTPEAETSGENVPEATAPDSDGDLEQVLGIATGANTLFFNPSLDVIEHAG